MGGTCSTEAGTVSWGWMADGRNSTSMDWVWSIWGRSEVLWGGWPGVVGGHLYLDRLPAPVLKVKPRNLETRLSQMANIWKFSSRTVTSLPIQRMEMEEPETAEGDHKRPEMGAWNMAREEGKGFRCTFQEWRTWQSTGCKGKLKELQITLGSECN